MLENPSSGWKLRYRQYCTVSYCTVITHRRDNCETGPSSYSAKCRKTGQECFLLWDQSGIHGVRGSVKWTLPCKLQSQLSLPWRDARQFLHIPSASATVDVSYWVPTHPPTNTHTHTYEMRHVDHVMLERSCACLWLLGCTFSRDTRESGVQTRRISFPVISLSYCVHTARYATYPQVYIWMDGCSTETTQSCTERALLTQCRRGATPVSLSLCAETEANAITNTHTHCFPFTCAAVVLKSLCAAVRSSRASSSSSPSMQKAASVTVVLAVTAAVAETSVARTHAHILAGSTLPKGSGKS